MKRDSNPASKTSLYPRVSDPHVAMSVTGTAKSGGRIAQATLNHFKGSQSKTNMSQIVMGNEDDSILDFKQIEDMMRASQKSNIFSTIPPAS
jgi:hypothetical protein